MTVPLGVELFGLGDALQRDLDGTLAALAAAGAEVVELPLVLPGVDEALLAQALPRHGLRCASVMLPLSRLQDDLAGAVALARRFGAQAVIVPGPLLPPGLVPRPPISAFIAALRERMDRALWVATAEALAACATALAEHGLRLGYHHHDLEFDRLDGQWILTWLAEHTAAAPVPPGFEIGFELDLGWTLAAGVDPLLAMQRLGSRLAWLHLKQRIDGAHALTPDGLDWPAVLAAARRAGVVGAYVEVEPPFPPELPALMHASLQMLRTC
jgi:sugar phosphate isomerase/epimerase